MDLFESVIHRSFRGGFFFFFLSFVTWVASLYLIDSIVPFGTQILFAFSISALTFFLLSQLEFFSPLNLIPRRSDFLLVASATLLSSIILNSSLIIFDSSYAMSWLFTFSISAVAAIIIFAFNYTAGRIFLEKGEKRCIVLAMHPKELKAFISEFSESGRYKYYDLLSLTDLRQRISSRNTKKIDLIVISHHAIQEFDQEGLLVRAHLLGVPIYDKREVLSKFSGRVSLTDSDLFHYVMSATRQTSFLRMFHALKVIIEPFLAAVLGIMLLPVACIIALGIKITSPGPILYTQIRTGYLGKKFLLYKFRSMRIDAEKNGPQWCSTNDDRITAFGKFIRATRLDEIPQLINVIRGEMFFVGPRPERPEIYRVLQKEIPLFNLRTIVRPGITGWAQVSLGYTASIEETRAKLEFDLFYIKHMSPRLDMLIFVKTILVAFLGDSKKTTLSQPNDLGDISHDQDNQIAPNKVAA